MKLLEPATRLSESSLWRFQGEYYQRQGPSAFAEGQVPWRIGSTPLMGLLCAELIETFATEVGLAGPVKVLELGGGNARFAFQLLRSAEARGLKLHYTFTDGAEANVRAAANHPQLQAFLDDGRLVVEQRDALNAPLGSATATPPEVVVAHYLFDTLPHDAYAIDSGRLIERRIELTGESLADATWTFEPAAPERVPPMVEPYARSLGQGAFTWPTGALQCLGGLGASPKLLLFSDKAVVNPARLRLGEPPALVRHGSVSCAVNVHALKAWWGWRPFFEPKPSAEPFGLYGAATGWADRQLEATRAQYDSTFGRSPSLRLLGLVDETVTQVPLPVERALELLVISQFDPDVFLRLAAPLVRAFRTLKGLPVSHLPQLIEALGRVGQAHFELPDPLDLQLELGRVFHQLGQLSLAVEAYRRSLERRGDSVEALTLLGAAQADLDRREDAEQSVNRALALDPGYAEARRLRDALAGSPG